MVQRLHITSGDIAGDILSKTGIDGEILVWHDVLYDGLRHSGWPEETALAERAVFLEELTGGGISVAEARHTLETQYKRLSRANADDEILLWFDGCLFDQSMLAHVLICLHSLSRSSRGEQAQIELICINGFPDIPRFNGLGQLNPEQMASLLPLKQNVTQEQFNFASLVDTAFANQDMVAFSRLAQQLQAPLPFVPAAVSRWLAEQPDRRTGLGRLETLIMETLTDGPQTPGEIFTKVAAADIPPQYWGDITLWQKINNLAARQVPLVRIDGPRKILPQWPGTIPLSDFTISALPIDG